MEVLNKENNKSCHTNIDVDLWQLKRLIKWLENNTGNGTSLITLIIPGDNQICKVQKLLTEEYGTASNIKSRVNRQSVISAIVSAQQKLKLYNKLPKNGLCIFTGLIEDKITCIGFEPFKTLKSFYYRCDNKFNVDPLKEMLICDNTYGFIIIDGSSCLFGTLSGNNKSVLKHVHVSLPKKHGRGGQSAQRFGRLREEKRHNYITIISEYATELFLKENKPIISGLILAGSAELKDDLNHQNILDLRLKNIILGIVDIAYGGNAGFSQAINLSANLLSNNIFDKRK